MQLEVNSRVGMTIEALSRMTGIRGGMPYSGMAVRQSLDSLYAAGLFTDVWVEVDPIEGGVAVIYNLTEKTLLADLRIKGNRVFWTRTLTDAMGLSIGEEFTDERWKASIARLMDFFQRHGYLRARLDSEVSQIAGTNEVAVTVKVREGSRAKIRETKFTGNIVYSPLRLWSLVRSTGGEFYGADILDEDIARLETLYRENGYLKAVVGPPEIRYEESLDEVAITIPVEAGTRVAVRFEGNAPFPEIQLMPLLLFLEERSYDETVFRASADRLADFYRAHGYPFVKVDYARQEIPDANLFQATFLIQPGNFGCLRTILFVGNTFFSADRLQEFIQTRPGNTLFCGTVDPDRSDADVKTIKNRYLEQGFAAVKVEARVEYNEERTLAYLIFAIAEGPRTRIAEIRFEGNRAMASDELRKTVRLRPDSPYDATTVRKDQEELLVLYHQHGYVYAEIDPQPVFSEDRSRATIRYRIREDEPVVIGRVLLNGNTFTQDDVILREVQVKPGDPYDETRIQISRRRIQQLGYLSNVRFEPINPISRESKEPVKDLRLTVQERPTKTLDLGIGYADVEHLRGFIQGTHHNLWGTGRSLSLRAEGSGIESKYSTTYREPWLLGYPMEGRLVAFDQTQVRTTYKLTGVGGTAGLEKNLTESLKSSLLYQIEFNNFTNVSEEVLAKEDQGRVNIATLNPSLILDARDNPFNPTSGTLSGMAFRLGAKNLGSEVQIRKATVQSNWFFPLTRWLVAALSARGGVVEKFGESKKVPPSEKFFLGGRSTVRGYEQDALGIVGQTIVPKADGTGVEFIGGNAMLLFNGEIRLSLPGGLGLVIFNDRGNVFGDYKDVDVNLLKSTVGAGIWFSTPVGPLRLDYGYKMDREENLCPTCAVVVKESRAELHFTLGFAF